eukprot:4693609-Pleurochrysis_carterae.AAC.1
MPNAGILAFSSRSAKTLAHNWRKSTLTRALCCMGVEPQRRRSSKTCANVLGPKRAVPQKHSRTCIRADATARRRSPAAQVQPYRKGVCGRKRLGN